jgi:hypothetical protein
LLLGGHCAASAGVRRPGAHADLAPCFLLLRARAQDYKEFLEDMLKPEDKNATSFITDYKEYHTGAVGRWMHGCGWVGGWVLFVKALYM